MRAMRAMRVASVLITALATPAIADVEVDFAQRTLPTYDLGLGLNAQFGFSVAVYGTLAVVGAPFARHSGVTRGAAYLYAYDGRRWVRLQELEPPSRASGDRYGWAVAIHDDTIVVTAPYRDRGADVDIGEAYVFRRGDPWTFVKTLSHSQGLDGELLGMSATVDGDHIVIGVPIYRDRRGAAVMYSRHLGGTDNWGELRTFQNADPANLIDDFGRSVVLHGDVLGISAPFQEFGGAAGVGTIHLFHRNQGGANQWGETQTLASSRPQTSSNFGSALAFNDDIVVVGAPTEGDAFDGSGAAYVFEKAFGAFAFSQRVAPGPEDEIEHLRFGSAVAVSGSVVVVGVPGTRGRNDVPGRVQQYVKRLGAWTPVGSWASPMRATADEFGTSVAATETMLVVGSRYAHPSGLAWGGRLLERIEQSREQQKCITTLNKSFEKLTKAGDKWRLRCLADHAKGMVDAAACVRTLDPKVAALEAKALATEDKGCRTPRNDFGPVKAAIIAPHARGLAADILHRIFDPDLDSVIERADSDKDASKCQVAAAKAALRCAATQIKEFNKCKARGLKKREIQSEAGLEDCGSVDPKGKISKACGVPSIEEKTLEKQCRAKGVGLRDALPACDESSAEDAGQCIYRRVTCAVCNALNDADGVQMDCPTCYD